MDQSAQYRLGYPAYRVFIFGVEVTTDVFSVSMDMHDGAAPNQCQISLNNELDKYVVTTNDLLYINNMEGSELRVPWLSDSSNPGSTNSSFISDKIKDPGVFSPVKKLLLTRKGAIKQSVELDTLTDASGVPIEASPIYSNYFGKDVSQYPMADGLPIFHPMDPVRVFFRDPFDPNKWYHMFAGFVSDMVETTNENNAKILTVTCEDVTKLFRYTRVFANPGITDASKVIFDGDLATQSFWSQKFHDYTLPEVLFTLIFGSDFSRESTAVDSHGATSTSPLRTRLRAIGHFCADLSFVATLGPPPAQGSQADEGEKADNATVGMLSVGSSDQQLQVPVLHLQDRLDMWQLLVDHEVQPSDMYTMATESDRFGHKSYFPLRKALVLGGTDANGKEYVDIKKVISYIGRNPDLYPVDGGGLKILMPRSMGTRNNNLLVKELISSYPLTSDSISVGQILSDTMSRIEFSMYCTPRGDIVMEMPLYDFDPDMFGKDKISKDAIASALQSVGGAKDKSGPGVLLQGMEMFGSTDKDPFMHNYVIKRGDTFSWDNAHVDEKVYTVAVAKHSIIWDQVFSDIVGDLQVVKRDALIPLYGYRTLPLTARGYIKTREAATLYANICLNRMNAEAHSYHITFVPNIRMWINRPVYIQGRNAIATTKSVRHSLTWGSSGEFLTSCDLYAGRTWKGEMSATEPNRPIYTSINGYGTSMLNYAILFGMAPKPDSIDSGLTPLTINVDAFTDKLNDIIKKGNASNGGK
jgi:hypothetical protein